MSHRLGYDETDPKSIEAYGKKLIGKTFAEVCDEDDIAKAGVVRETINYETRHEDRKRKGGLGELIEERFFHYQSNNDARPDFDKAGVELKVTPYRKNKNGTLSAKERLIITMIDYCNVVEETFEESHLWQKSRLILLIYYLYQKEFDSRLDYRIDFVKLFSPPEQDVEIIKHDFEVIVNKIKAGKAHELSEGDTLYLGAAPKAASSQDRRKQPFSDELAKPRAFAFKNSYMTYVLNNYIVPGKVTYEPIIKTKAVKSFEDYVVDKISTNCNHTEKELCNKFEIDIQKKPKNLEAMLAYRMLGIKGNHAEEFEKANIVVKTIRIEKNNTIRENMSFPTFKFKELVKEEWEDSTFGNYLRETRFLFVIYKYDHLGELRLKGCQFWNIPYEDLEGNVHEVWEETKRVLQEGLKVESRNGKNYNNFPKAADNPVCHVRPHARNAKDTYELPDGRAFPKQCFWLNNTYILSQLNKKYLDD
ncbi:restriction endonuclease [Mordavella massiliensis]|nr:restriction endonuclease [Mordavella massiliensis]